MNSHDVGQTKKILVIEDMEVIREEIVEILGFENFDVISAPDGLAGIQMAREQMPDLIICDITMPEMDGFEVLKELRSDSDTATMPFIFLTALTNRESRRKGMALGADDYISKPFTTVELLTAIRTRLAKESAFETGLLRSFSHSLVTRQEYERRQIARKLLDDIGPQLTGLKLALEMNRRLPPDAFESVIEEAHELVDTIAEQVNDMAVSLWPSPLDYLSLLPVLMWQAERYSARTQITVHFQHSDLNRNIPPELRIAVYRIVQEALENVEQHAGVDAVQLQVWMEDDNLRIHVTDVGKGFDIEQVLRSDDASGLIMMRERIRALNGYLTIASTVGEGTQLIVRLPLDEFVQQNQAVATPGAGTARLSQQFDTRPLVFESKKDRADDFETASQQQYSGRRIRIILADTSAIVRRGLLSLIEAEAGLSVTAEVRDGLEVINAVKESKPDILVLSLTLPGPSGLDEISRLVQTAPSTRILILSAFTEGAFIAEVFRRGAAGYVLNDAVVDNLVFAIHEVMAGRRYLSPGLSERSVELFAQQGNRPVDTRLDAYGTLTGREREVLHLVVEGYTNVEIADQFVISPRTVETHRANMMRKLGLRNKTDLMRYAIKRGLIEVDH